MASCPTTAAAKQVLPQQQLKAPHASAHLLWNICTTSHKPLRLPVTHLGPGGAVWSSRCVTGVKDWSLQPFFSLPSPIPAPRRQSKGTVGSCWEQTWHRHLHPGEEWQFWTGGLARGTQCAHADCTGTEAALSRITAQTAAGLPSVLCTVSSSPSEKHSPVGASVQQPLQPSYTQLVALAHNLLWTGFYFSSAQILNSGSSSQDQPDVPWHRGHQLPQPVWSTAPPPTQLPGGTTRSCSEPPAGYGSNAEGKEMPGLSTITLFSSQISSFSPVPSHHFLFQINWLQHNTAWVLACCDPPITASSPALHCKNKAVESVCCFNQL